MGVWEIHWHKQKQVCSCEMKMKLLRPFSIVMSYGPCAFYRPINDQQLSFSARLSLAILSVLLVDRVITKGIQEMISNLTGQKSLVFTRGALHTYTHTHTHTNTHIPKSTKAHGPFVMQYVLKLQLVHMQPLFSY